MPLKYSAQNCYIHLFIRIKILISGEKVEKYNDIDTLYQ